MIYNSLKSRRQSAAIMVCITWKMDTGISEFRHTYVYLVRVCIPIVIVIRVCSWRVCKSTLIQLQLN